MLKFRWSPTSIVVQQIRRRRYRTRPTCIHQLRRGSRFELVSLLSSINITLHITITGFLPIHLLQHFTFGLALVPGDSLRFHGIPLTQQLDSLG